MTVTAIFQHFTCVRVRARKRNIHIMIIVISLIIPQNIWRFGKEIVTLQRECVIYKKKGLLWKLQYSIRYNNIY